GGTSRTRTSTRRMRAVCTGAAELPRSLPSRVRSYGRGRRRCPMTRRLTCLASLLALSLAACTGGGTVDAGTEPPGRDESARTNVLEAGAAALQDNGPLAKLDVHLVGFHPMKLHPDMQMEAHHFCRQVNEDFA